MIGWRKRVDRDDDEAGFSLIELIVVMGIFSMILAIITASIVAMLGQTRRETNLSDNLDNARRIIQKLDMSVRYANDINTPGVGGDGSSYVEWQTGNTGQQQTCTQWRYVPATGVVQTRSWKPLLNGVGSISPTAWVQLAGGISLTGVVPIWQVSSSTSGNTHEILTATFTITHGGPSSKPSQSQVAVTAINSGSVPTSPAVCTEVARS